ncbi:MAG: PQQ-binding-like beta-propeller repeat protein, partial [Desulfobacterales bacterium]
QNFANWYSYHRRREFAAKAALSQVIKELSGVRIAILGINGKIVLPLEPVKVKSGNTIADKTDYLLAELFNYMSRGETPLRQGLLKVGEYIANNALALENVAGDKPPYATEAEGGACQQCFTVIVTDGYYNGADPAVGNVDGEAEAPYRDENANTLADVAMHYYHRDLAPQAGPEDDQGLPDKVPTNDYDKAFYQHMVTYGLAFGVNGTLNPDDYTDDFFHKETGQRIRWPAVQGKRQPEAIDDLWHAAVNGRGRFLSAEDPHELSSELLKAIRNITERTASSACVTANRDELYGQVGDEVQIFHVSYDTTDWSGDVKAFEIDPTTGDIDTAAWVWSASEELQKKDGSRRNVFTFDPFHKEGLPFVFEQLTDAQKHALDSDARLVDYIRGKEITGFRDRRRRLGDIVHSSAVFADDMVYVGANDGMLHAFNTRAKDQDQAGPEPGEELWAYIPNLVFENLKFLADPDYTHKYFVDLTPTVQKGYGVLGDDEDRIETILVGGLGKGGKGYFALNISDARTVNSSDEAADLILWEFPAPDTAEKDRKDMGYSFSRPVIVPSNHPDYPWIVICGNGYDSPGGKAVLFILNAGTGEIIRKIEAHNPALDPYIPYNGLSTPMATDVDDDGKVDFVYAGDLQGNLWKFDLRDDKDVNEWEVAYKDTAEDPQPLFQALGPEGDPQPITIRPEVMAHPQKHGYLVFFGTGKYLGDADLSEGRTQTVYGIWDYGDSSFYQKKWSADDDREYLGAFNRPHLSNQHEATLLEQTEIDWRQQANDAGLINTLRTLSDKKPNWMTVADTDSVDQFPDPSDQTVADLQKASKPHLGWYFDLPLPGERVISDGLIRDGKLIMITFTPDKDRCRAGGFSILHEMDAASGGNLQMAQLDINGDLEIDEGDLIEKNFGSAEEAYLLKIAPTGLWKEGNLQPPVILRLTNGAEMKFLSSSLAKIETVRERAARLGISYWMEIRHDD